VFSGWKNTKPGRAQRRKGGLDSRKKQGGRSRKSRGGEARNLSNSFIEVTTENAHQGKGEERRGGSPITNEGLKEARAIGPRARGPALLKLETGGSLDNLNLKGAGKKRGKSRK